MACEHQGNLLSLILAWEVVSPVSFIHFLFQMVRQDLYVIVYGESKSTEIVEAARVRLPNPNPPIGKSTFHKIELPVPDEIVD